MKRLATIISFLAIACVFRVTPLAAGEAQQSPSVTSVPQAPRPAPLWIDKRLFVKVNGDRNDQETHPVSLQVQTFDSAEAADQGWKTNMIFVSVAPTRLEEIGGIRLHVWDTTMGFGERAVRVGPAVRFRIGNDVMHVSWKDKPASRDFLIQVMEAVAGELKAARKPRP